MASLELKQEIQEALKNQTLSRTLGTFCATYPAKKNHMPASISSRHVTALKKLRAMQQTTSMR